MKTRLLAFLPALPLFCVAIAIAPPLASAQLVNGSFEDGLSGWTTTGSVTSQSGAPYVSTNGTKVAAFNAGNATPKGTLQQDFGTTPGQGYLLDFDAGNLAYANHEQKVRVIVSQDNGAVTLLDVRLTIPATTLGGATTWRSGHHYFQTGQQGATRIRIIDESSFTANLDLVVDHVRVTPAATGTIVPTGPLVSGDAAGGFGRADHASVRLKNGKVLASGGYTNLIGLPKAGIVVVRATAEIYDPVSGSWTATGSLASPRCGHTATLLGNGKVLVVGGQTTNQGLVQHADAELYDPATGTWSPAGSLSTGCANHTATLLTNGKVLVAGGDQFGSPGPFATAELYDPGTNSWSATGSLGDGHSRHTATLLANGKVLVSGGSGVEPPGPSEIYDPATGTWSASGNLNTERYDHTATRLEDGRVLVSGGTSTSWVVNSCEIYDPALGTWSFTGTLDTTRHHHEASLLPDGTVIVIGGGYGATYDVAPVCEIYHPATGLWTSGPSLVTPRVSHTITALDDGNIVIAGGLPRPVPTYATASPCELFLAPPPGNFVVTTLADEDDGWNSEGTGNSLREAVWKANTTSSGSPHSITFAPGLSGGTISLGGSPIVSASASVVIDGSPLPSGLTVSGNGLSGLFRFLFTPAEVRGLTLTGSAGSAIEVGDTRFDLIDCIVQGNNTAGNGAGLAVYGLFGGMAFIDGCTFTGNSATGSGGAIQNEAVVHVTDSTFSGNHAGGTGGAIQSGLYRSGMTLINSTLTGNTSGSSGGAIRAATFHVTHCTITGNTAATGTGGGISSFSTTGVPEIGFTLANSIVAENSAPAGPDLSGTVDAEYGVNFIGGNPMLAPLANYGGNTWTRPPLPGSPVIDAATALPDGPATDQAGRPRPAGPLPDIGAIEAFPFSYLPLVDTDGDGIDDRLEPAYQLAVGVNDSAKDSDGDGSPDATEIANMSNPLDAGSLLKILSITPSSSSPGGNLFDIRFTSFPGLHYSVERDDELDFAGPGTTIHPHGIATGQVSEISLPLAPGKDFVRVRRDP